jgi:hypothetical protein
LKFRDFIKPRSTSTPSPIDARAAANLLPTHERSNEPLKHYVKSGDAYDPNAYFVDLESPQLHETLDEEVRRALKGHGYSNNEIRLVSAILGGTTPPVWVVGGIGVGKSSICKELPRMQKAILPTPTNAGVTLGPLFLYFNVLGGNSSTLTEVIANFTERLLDHLRVGAGLSSETEFLRFADFAQTRVGDGSRLPWVSNVLAVPECEVALRDYRRSQNARTAETLCRTRERAIDIRNRRPSDQLDYCAHLLAFVAAARAPQRKDRFDRLRWIVVFDNVDKLQDQRGALLEALVSFGAVCGVPLVVPVRQSTFKQDLDGTRSVLRQGHQYTGHAPRIVVSRLLRHKGDEMTAAASTGSGEAVEPTYQFQLTQVVSTLTPQSPRSEKNERPKWADFHSVFDAFSGRSVRKGIALARQLLAAPKGHLADLSKVPRSTSLLTQALLGRSDLLPSQAADDETENIFAGAQTTTPLLKLRILSMLRDRYPVRPDSPAPFFARDLMSALELFGYRRDEVTAAIAEMKARHKRLIWSDLSTEHRAFDESHNRRESLFLTSIGKGYIDVIVSNGDYLLASLPDCDIDMKSERFIREIVPMEDTMNARLNTSAAQSAGAVQRPYLLSNRHLFFDFGTRTDQQEALVVFGQVLAAKYRAENARCLRMLQSISTDDRASLVEFVRSMHSKMPVIELFTAIRRSLAPPHQRDPHVVQLLEFVKQEHKSFWSTIELLDAFTPGPQVESNKPTTDAHTEREVRLG